MYIFIPLRKNTEMARRMASESLADSTKTSTSYDSSSATSKIQYPIHTKPLILQFTAVFRNDMDMIEVPSFYHRRWAPEYPEFVNFIYDGITYQIRLRQHQAKRLHEFRKDLSIFESMMIKLLACNNKFMFDLYFISSLECQTCGRSQLMSRQYIWTVEITQSMLGAPGPLRLPNCAMPHVNACGRHMTIFKIFGPPLQWNVVVVDRGVGRKYVVQPWYQFLVDNDFSHACLWSFYGGWIFELQWGPLMVIFHYGDAAEDKGKEVRGGLIKLVGDNTYNGTTHFVRFRRYGSRYFFSDSLKEFRRTHGIDDSVIMQFFGGDKNITFEVDVIGPILGQRCPRLMARIADKVKTIDGSKETLKLAVRITELWFVGMPGRSKQAEMGDQIHVVCKQDQLKAWKMDLKEGCTYVMHNFRVNIIGVVDEVVFRHISPRSKRVVFKLMNLRLSELGIEIRSVLTRRSQWSSQPSGSAQLSSRETFISKSEAKSISEMNNLCEEFVCVTVGTITRIVMDNHSWCYASCIQCHKKIDVYTEPFVCPCGKHNDRVVLRYRVEVMVNYKDESTKFLQWYRECTKLIEQLADEVNTLKIEDGDLDLNASPKALDKLLGHLLAFKVKIQPQYKNSIVLKCSTDLTLINDFLDMLPDAELFFFIIVICISVATYPSAGGRRVTRGMRVPRKEYARSRHQRLFEENVGKTRKDAIYELLSERFGSCIYARGSKIGEVVAAQLAQASSARPGEPGCFLQKQQPSGGIFWRAQVGLGAICTPIFTKNFTNCLMMGTKHLTRTKERSHVIKQRSPDEIRQKNVYTDNHSGISAYHRARRLWMIQGCRMTKFGLCLSSGPPPLDDKRVRITVRMTKFGLCLSSGPPPLDDKRVRITVRMTKLGLCLSSGPPPLDDKRVRITVRMTKLGLCLSSGPPPLDDKRVRITVRMTKFGLCLSSGPPPLDDKRVRITVRMTKLGLCLSSGPPPLDDKRVRITVRYLRVSSGPPPLDDTREYARSRHQRLFEENVGKTGKDAIYELLSESKIGEVVAAQLAQASQVASSRSNSLLEEYSGGPKWAWVLFAPPFLLSTPPLLFLTCSKIKATTPFDSNDPVHDESQSISITADHDPLIGLPLTPTKRQPFNECDDEARSSQISPA
ncbi:hypothetical protein HKD37_15G042914 [Glycine soja]